MEYRVMLLTALCVAQPCFAGGPGRAPNRAPEEAAIRKVFAASESAWNRHDAQAFSRIFAPDAELVNVHGIAYPGGPVGIERAHRPLFAAMFRDSRVTTDRVLIRFVRPDVATADVYWRMTGARDRSGQPRGLVTGLRNMVLTKEGGAWRIAVFHDMEVDAPPRAGAPPTSPAQGRS